MESLMDKLRSFLGLGQGLRNDFRNPIWVTEEETDEHDELYTRTYMDQYGDPMEMHREITKQVQDLFRSFGSVFGDMSAFFNEGQFNDFQAITSGNEEPENFNNNNIRDYYLKPGYTNRQDLRKDVDLDGKISSNDISGLFKQQEDGQLMPSTPFNGNLVPGRSFCQTIITTSVKKPDGTVETRRIVKNGNDVVEETVTTTEPNRGPNPITHSNMFFSSLSSLLGNFH